MADSDAPPRLPIVLAGHREIAGYLDVSTREVEALFQGHRAPIWRHGGRIVATAAALDDYRTLTR